MFKELSVRAQKLLTLYVQAEAKNHGNEYLLPEHVLLALLKSTEGLGYSVLKHLDLDLHALQLKLEQSLPVSSEASFASDLPPSRRLKTLIDLSAIESRSLNQHYIGTEHLVLSAFHEQGSVAYIFLKETNIPFAELRNATNFIQQNEQTSAPPATPKNQNRDVQIENQLVGMQRPNSHRSTQQNQNRSFLQEYSRDLTLFAQKGKLDPVVGRETEVNRVVQILSRRTKNNPVLVGEPGVGKTAIIEGLAQKIINGNVPKNLYNMRVLTLDLASVIAGTKYRGEFEDRIKRIMKEIIEQKNIILFIDELHTLIGAGGAEGSMDASNILKPALSRGELQCIGATTNAEYRKYFERDAALERRFQVVQIKEPSESDTLAILHGLKRHYQDYHRVIYDDNALDLIVKLTKRYITERMFPDKAIDIMDEAGAIKKIAANTFSPDLHILEKKINQLSERKTRLVTEQDYEQAAKVRDEVARLQAEAEQLKKTFGTEEENQYLIVNTKDIYEVVSAITGIPLNNIDENETKKLLSMEKEFHKSIVGQNEAIELIASAIRRSRSGVSSKHRPLGSFIFLGPTGVGKTLLAKTLSNFLFGTNDALIRIDMSDYMEKHNSSRLIGAPPGYVGYEEGGLLTERVRKNPYSVILLDEIEKAHRDVFNLLLQVLEEGELRDSLGHVVNFRNTVIIMTSNAGAREISNENRLGFTLNSEGLMNYKEIKSNALTELKRIMNPELINRIDDIIIFNALTDKEIADVLEIQILDFAQRLCEQNLFLHIKPEAKQYLIKKGYDPHFGARPLRRVIQREIEDPLSKKLLEGLDDCPYKVIVDYKNETLTVNLKKQSKKQIDKEIVATVGV
ncbi:MAG: ATP-dependent Clp protease ATP-binding subunit [Treponemataceae bacterium]